MPNKHSDLPIEEHSRGKLHVHGSEIHVKGHIRHMVIANCSVHSGILQRTAEANAARFALVWNNHAKLVEALRKFVEWGDGKSSPMNHGDKFLDAINGGRDLLAELDSTGGDDECK